MKSITQFLKHFFMIECDIWLLTSCGFIPPPPPPPAAPTLGDPEAIITDSWGAGLNLEFFLDYLVFFRNHFVFMFCCLCFCKKTGSPSFSVFSAESLADCKNKIIDPLISYGTMNWQKYIRFCNEYNLKIIFRLEK